VELSPHLSVTRSALQHAPFTDAQASNRHKHCRVCFLVCMSALCTQHIFVVLSLLCTSVVAAVGARGAC
jgi:hypothetical protein